MKIFVQLLSPAYPPDYFSATGQRWGNPLYRWDVMERDGFAWWIERIKNTLALVDIVRIDHFRGFAAYWEIPADEKTAVHGRWVGGPKEQLFDTVLLKLGKLPIIAEDLGLMTDDVIALRDRFNFPGMKVLQFAFAGDPKNPFLPHNYLPNVVVYSGTHDNDTTIGWFKSATEREQSFVKKYTGTDGKEIHWDLDSARSAISRGHGNLSDAGCARSRIGSADEFARSTIGLLGVAVFVGASGLLACISFV